MAHNFIFPVSLGFLDGIITPLMITSHLMLSRMFLPFALAIRIALGSASVGAFSYFIAEFVSNRAELVRISKLINPGKPLKFLRGKMSSEVFVLTTVGTLASAGSSFLGSLVPLLSYSLSGSSSIFSITLAEIAMGILGVAIARVLKTNSVLWISGMLLFGVLITILGFFVQIVE